MEGIKPPYLYVGTILIRVKLNWRMCHVAAGTLKLAGLDLPQLLNQLPEPLIVSTV